MIKASDSQSTPFREALLRFSRQPPHALLLLSSRFGLPTEGLKSQDAGDHEGRTEGSLSPSVLTPTEIEAIAEILCKFPSKLVLKSSELVRDPDLCIVDRSRKVLRLEDLEPLRARVAFPPQAAKKRLFVIEMAQRLTTHSANSLLKALEEPVAEALFVLTAPSVSHVLPTLVSRCVRIQMGLASHESATEGQYLYEPEADDLLFLKTLVSKIAHMDPLLLFSANSSSSPHPKQSSALCSAPSATYRCSGSNAERVPHLLQLSADLERCEGLAKKYQPWQLIDAMVSLATKERMSFGIRWLVEKLRHWQNTRDYNPSTIMRLTEFVLAARHTPNAPRRETL